MDRKTLTPAKLDSWIKKNVRINRQGDKYLMSRFSALKELYGENVAIWTLNELAIQQCTARGA